MTAIPAALVRTNLFVKTNLTFRSVARNTSCSRGWLHLVVQMTFGAITVASFVLIMLMTFQWSSSKQPFCKTTSCRITCSEGPYDENDIIAAITAADTECKLKLTLKEPQFPNGTLPENWLDKAPYFIETLSIVGGNLNDITNNAFMGQFAANLETLMLEDITISTWTSDTLVGLAELNFLRITNCNLKTVRHDALRAVYNTIKGLSITGSGTWNPSQITGSGPNTCTKLTIVNFSRNHFGSILGASSFTGLENCKDLYLNSCGITAIGEGAFDSLKNIGMLFLNDNFLITIPPGLFENILQSQININSRINLQNNFWQCDCSQQEIMQLSKQGLLLVDPFCYHPVSLHGKPMSGLEELCSSKRPMITYDYVNIQANVDYDSKSECYNGKEFMPNKSFVVISPSPIFQCVIHNMSSVDRHGVSASRNKRESSNSWLRALLLRHNSFSMMQISATMNDTNRYGLLWFRSECPYEVYCFNILPQVLRLYNIDPDAKYTFCPYDFFKTRVNYEYCVDYDVSDTKVSYNKYSRPLMYALTGLLCLIFGAVLVYGIIRTNPYLLKGSKRVLFVKHRSVDALVLPPKIPLRNSLLKEAVASDKKVYTVSEDTKLLYPCHLLRSNSVRSDKSSSPTYISAMQPTEAQLAEWRLRYHFEKNVSITSISSEASTYCWVCDNDMNSTNVPYEHFK